MIDAAWALLAVLVLLLVVVQILERRARRLDAEAAAWRAGFHALAHDRLDRSSALAIVAELHPTAGFSIMEDAEFLAETDGIELEPTTEFAYRRAVASSKARRQALVDAEDDDTFVVIEGLREDQERRGGAA